VVDALTPRRGGCEDRFVRDHSAEVARDATSERPPAPPAGRATAASTRTDAILALQRSAGNRATRALILQRQPVTIPEVTVVGEPTDRDQMRAIQRELRRLRLYSKGIDGIEGFFTDQGLTEAFGGDDWFALGNDEILAGLQAAVRPPAGGGHQLRYAELFKDGVLDVTYGFGYLEGELEGRQAMVDYSKSLPVAAGRALAELGFSEDREGARAILGSVGRSVGADAIGAFYVKRAAFTYAPVAGTPRDIDVVVRVISDAAGDRGGDALDAFVDAMANGDVAYYSGHGRFGSGPDFDQDYVVKFLDDAGNVVQVVDDDEVVENILRKEGDPWAVFQRRVSANPPTIVVQVTDAGNLWLNAKNAHPAEFGAKLMYWALEHGARVASGTGGRLEQATAASSHNYRVLVFDGCRSQDYDRSLRGTGGFGTRDADIIETTRTIGFTKDISKPERVEVQAFKTFLSGLMAQASGERIVKDMGAAMKEYESGFTGAPYTFSGLGDNPSR
jgi:hypothetical protein